jgi:hypothetical protein
VHYSSHLCSLGFWVSQDCFDFVVDDENLLRTIPAEYRILFKQSFLDDAQFSFRRMLHISFTDKLASAAEGWMHHVLLPFMTFMTFS